jgi:hypothetical protein
MRVCKKWFPKTDGFFMDDRLAMQLEVLLKNIRNDWDFTIIITGQGEVRVGKSMIAMQIACYWAYEMFERYKIKLPFNINENFVFEGKELIKKGNYLGITYQYSPLVFDEAGADLEGRKIQQGSTQDVLDYFRECGQYNMLNILVLPEYFDLPKGIALSRSIFLIDVFYQANEEAIFERGFFNFYSRRSKKWLYLKGKRDLNYSCVKSDFGVRAGKFFRFYPIDKKEYDTKKLEALKKRETKHRNKFQSQRDACIFLLCGESQEKGTEKGEKIMTQDTLSKRLEQLTGIYMDRSTLSDALRRMNADLSVNESDNE